MAAKNSVSGNKSSENIWAFFHSSPFDRLITDLPFRTQILKRYNDKIVDILVKNDINDINLYMRAIESTTNGYYFKFNLEYGREEPDHNFTVISSIIDSTNNFHVSFHQKDTKYGNQTHIKTNINHSSVPLNFERGVTRVSNGGKRVFVDILNVNVNAPDVQRFCDSVGYSQINLQTKLHLSPGDAKKLYDHIVTSIVFMCKVFTDIFREMDNNDLWTPAVEGKAVYERQASQLAVGGNFVDKYLKYKLKYLELKKMFENM